MLRVCSAVLSTRPTPVLLPALVGLPLVLELEQQVVRVLKLVADSVIHESDDELLAPAGLKAKGLDALVLQFLSALPWTNALSFVLALRVELALALSPCPGARGARPPCLHPTSADD